MVLYDLVDSVNIKDINVIFSQNVPYIMFM